MSETARIRRALIRPPFARRRAGTEQSLIERAASGDEDAAEQLARAWWPRAHATALGVLADQAAASDVAQEAVLAALGSLEDFDPERPAGPWLTRIATNKALDHIRREAVRPEPTDLQGTGTAAGPSELVELVELLAELPVETRAMVVLHHLGGFSSAEIAEVLDTRPGTVRSTISRALDQLDETQALEVDR